MNYIYIFLEIIFTFFLMIIFYSKGKKDGLYLYIALMSGLLSVFMFKSINLFSFEVNTGIPIVMGIFICNGIIIQRYGIDEVKRIIYTSGVSYLTTSFGMFLLSLYLGSGYEVNINSVFDGLFGYSIGNFRIFIGGFISLIFMLWCNSYIYYYVRRSKNILWFSNITSSLIVQMLESIIFVLLGYLGDVSFTLIFGMIVIRYLIKIVTSVIGLVPVYMIVKMKDK